MKKRFIAIIVVAVLIFLFGWFIYSSGYEFGKSYRLELDTKGFHLVEEGNTDESDGEIIENEEKDLEAFENININADICKLSLEPSDKNCIKINNNVKGSVITYKVEGNTLTVKQSVKNGFMDMITNKKGVEITLCYDSSKLYKRISIDNDDGNVIINGMKCDEISISNDLGNVALNNVLSKKVDGDIDAGDITFDSCTVEDVDLESDLGNIRADSVVFSNSFKADSDSGNINFSGRLDGRCEVSCDLGNINMQLEGRKEDYNINAKVGLGNLRINGSDEGNRVNTGSGSVSIKAECDSGNITFNFSEQ